MAKPSRVRQETAHPSPFPRLPRLEKEGGVDGRRAVPPLGYRAEDHKLIIIDSEARSNIVGPLRDQWFADSLLREMDSNPQSP
jgi:hypothetical protein